MGDLGEGAWAPLCIILIIIDHFRYIKIQLDSEAYRTQTEETERPCVFISPVCVL